MPTFTKCDKDVELLAKSLIDQYETHQPLSACEVRIDLVFAFADEDDKGRLVNDALTKNGVKALGLTRKLSLKERVMGRGDAEIALDGNYWSLATPEQQAALLDHELHHISVKCDRSGNPQYDDHSRPQVVLRKHDVEVGWFKVIAERHGAASIERQQARRIMDSQGQFYWPDVAPTMHITGDGIDTGPMPMDTLTKVNALSARKAGAQ